ncbi:hypothetical protein Aspvir_002185, partial [Aspergillus viridinutans]
MSADIPDRGPLVRVVTAVVITLSTVVVLLRFISRGLIVRHLSGEDYCLLLAWLIAIGLSASVILATTNGLGRYDSDIPSDWEYRLLQWTYVFTVLY